MTRRLVRFVVASGLVSLLVAFLVGLVVSPASAAPADPCALLTYKMHDACENTQKLVNGNNTNTPGLPNAVTDPLGSLAKSTGQGAAYLIDQIGSVVNSTTVNFTSMGWLVVYAVVFGASTLLMIVLWIGAVIKRVIRGRPPVEAIGEAVGFLWIAVLASAFTPVVLAGVVVITDGLTNGIIDSTQGTLAQLHIIPSKTAGPGAYLAPLSTNLRNADGLSDGGAILFTFVAFLSLVTACLLWVEMLARSAMLYVAGVFATMVYTGLVDKDLWSHIKRYIQMIVAIDLIKPILVVVLLTGEGVSSTAPTGGIASILSGTSILWIAVFGQAMIYRMIPVIGDDLSYGRNLRGGIVPAQVRARLGAMTGAAGVTAGMGAHADRGGLARLAEMNVRMQPGGGAAPGGEAQNRMRPEPPAAPPPRRPD